MGDYGEISSESCACGFGQVGFDACLNNIRSYEKLTGEGVTFVDTDFIRIVERDLPERFGGRSTDYQLVEKEDSRGFTHLQLLVSPRVGEIQETEILDRFLTHPRRAEASPACWSQSRTEMSQQSNMLQLVREVPGPKVTEYITPSC